MITPHRNERTIEPSVRSDARAVDTPNDLLRFPRRVISGYRPAKEPHLGYYGAISWITAEQRRYPGTTWCFVADWHAIPNWSNKRDLEEQTLTITAALLALGVDPSLSVVFAQSHVHELGEMMWLVSSFAPPNVLRVASAHGDETSPLSYRVLMAADALSLRATKLAVGGDQRRNAEAVRRVARAVNRRLDEQLFPVPEIAARPTIPGIDGHKMDSARGNHIPIFAGLAPIRKAVQKIQTDSRAIEEPKDPDTCTVFRLYESIAPANKVAQLRERYLRGGVGYDEAKYELTMTIASTFAEPAERFAELRAHEDELRGILRQGARTARLEARATLRVFRERLGLTL